MIIFYYNEESCISYERACMTALLVHINLFVVQHIKCSLIVFCIYNFILSSSVDSTLGGVGKQFSLPPLGQNCQGILPINAQWNCTALHPTSCICMCLLFPLTARTSRNMLSHIELTGSEPLHSMIYFTEHVRRYICTYPVFAYRN